MGSCNNASPTTTVLTIARAISAVKPCCRQYTGSSVRIIASNAANNATAQAIAGRLRQKRHSSANVTLKDSAVGAPERPSNSNGASVNRPTPTQNP